MMANEDVADTFDILAGLNLSKIHNGEKLQETYKSWASHYPSYAKDFLRRRKRDDSLWFELLVHELLLNLDCEVVVLDIDNNSKTPDFLARYDERCCYVEATTVNPHDNPSVVDRNLNGALKYLNKLSSHGFHIRITVKGKISRTLTRCELKTTFGKLLSENDPIQVHKLIREYGEWAAPHAEIAEEDWSLRGELVPKSRGNMRVEDSPGLIIESIGSYIGDASSQVQSAVTKKAKKYRDLVAPLVVAVNVLDVRFDGEAALAALFGQEQITFNPNNPEDLGRLTRNPDGVWVSRSRNPHGHLAAVIVFNSLFWWNPHGSVCLYLNPFIGNPALPKSLYKLPHAKGENGYGRRIEGADLDYLLFANSVRQ